MLEELMNTILFCDLIDTSIPTLLNLLSFPNVSLASIFVGRKEENPKYKQLILNLFFFSWEMLSSSTSNFSNLSESKCRQVNYECKIKLICPVLQFTSLPFNYKINKST